MRPPSRDDGAVHQQTRPDGLPIRIVIADDHDLFRRGLQAVVSLENDLQIVGEAATGEEAIAKVVALAPDVVLLDVRMPSGGGIAACHVIREQAPKTKILILTASDDQEDLFAAIKAGATGYLLKDVETMEIAESIRRAHSGQAMVPPGMASHLIKEFSRLSNESAADEQSPHLTGRELEVLGLIARGRANREIATELFISENTVKNHVRNILEKLQLHSRVEAAMYAMRRNLIEP